MEALSELSRLMTNERGQPNGAFGNSFVCPHLFVSLWVLNLAQWSLFQNLATPGMPATTHTPGRPHFSASKSFCHDSTGPFESAFRSRNRQRTLVKGRLPSGFMAERFDGRKMDGCQG
jgi:hypothetical protein